MTNTILQKTCKCVSKASGPRFIISEGIPVPPFDVRVGTIMYPSRYVYNIQWVPMACDKCNAPWIPVEKERRRDARVELEKLGELQKLKKDLGAALKEVKKTAHEVDRAMEELARMERDDHEAHDQD